LKLHSSKKEESKRKEAAVRHRVFFSQVEYCDNLIFLRQGGIGSARPKTAGCDCTNGQPKKTTMIVGGKVTGYYKGKLQTVIEDLDFPSQ
jgi:hypothetical protein